VKIVGYRFVENEKNKARDGGNLFNFSPCFARVDGQYVFSSTMELCRTLVDSLKEEPKSDPKPDDADSRHRFSWQGLALLVEANREQTTTELTLREGGDDALAASEYKHILELLDALGTIDAAVFYGPQQFRAEVRVKLKQPISSRR